MWKENGAFLWARPKNEGPMVFQARDIGPTRLGVGDCAAPRLRFSAWIACNLPMHLILVYIHLSTRIVRGNIERHCIQPHSIITG